MKVKIVHNKEIRVWKYPSHNKYQSILSFIAQTFNLTNPSSYTLQYCDDEGDNIVITNDNDIDDALLCAKEESRKSLKIFLISTLAMDSFLNDALSDIFNTKPISKSNTKSIHIPSTYPSSNKSKSRTMSPQEIINIIPKNKNKNILKPMDPVDILASMFQEEQHQQINNPLNNIHSKKDINRMQIKDLNNIQNDTNNIQNRNDIKNNGIDVEDILNSMVMDINSNGNVLEHKNNNELFKEDILNSMVMDMNNNGNDLEEIKHNSDEKIVESDEELLTNLLQEDGNNKENKNKNTMIQAVTDEELLSNLLNDSENDECILNNNQIDPQDVINSIVNKVDENNENNGSVHVNDGDDVTGNIQLKINEYKHNEIKEENIDMYGMNNNENENDNGPPVAYGNVPNIDGNNNNENGNINNNNNNANDMNGPPVAYHANINENMNDVKNDVNNYGNINNNNEIVNENINNNNMNPYAGNINANVPPAPFTARSPKKENANNTYPISNDNVNENENDNETANALALFEDLEIPAHKIGVNDDNDNDNDVLSESNNNELNEPNESELEEIRKSLANPMSFHNANMGLIMADSKRENLLSDNDINENKSNENHTMDVNDNNSKIESESDNDINENEIHENKMNNNHTMDINNNNIKNENDINNENENKNENESENKINDNDIHTIDANNGNENESNNNSPNDYNDNDIDKLYAELDQIDMDFEINRIKSIGSNNISENNNNENNNNENNNNENDNINNAEAAEVAVSDEIVIGIDPSNFNSESDEDMDIDLDITHTTPDPIPQPKLEPISPPVIEPKLKPISDAKPEAMSEPITDAIDMSISDEKDAMSPRDIKRESARILREEQRSQQKKQKLVNKHMRLAQKKALLEYKKQAKEEEKLKRQKMKENLKKQQKYEKLRRIRLKELNQFRRIEGTECDIFSPNKNWYPIKFILNTCEDISTDEYETYEDLIQIIELTVTKKYKIHPSFIECIFNNNNNKLPTKYHCIVYVYYNWMSVLKVKYQSINLGFNKRNEKYISKVNVFRMPIDHKSEIETTNVNDIYDKLLEKYIESEMNKYKMKNKKLSPLKKWFGKNPSKSQIESPKPPTSSYAVLLPDNCEPTPNFRWKFDLTKDYLLFDPLLNDNILCYSMHEYEIYFVQIRSEAVVNEFPRKYDIFVVYLNTTENINNLICNINKPSELLNNNNNEIGMCLGNYFENNNKIINEIMSYLKYNRCYGFVTVSKNTMPNIQNPKKEQITFHYGSIGEWIKCAIVGEKDFEYDLKELQNYGKWDNKQHISLIAFLKSIQSTYSM